MTTTFRRTRRAALALILLVWSVLAPGAVALADEGDVAWSVSPCTQDGTVDGRVRLEMQVDPGSTVTDHVLVANASTTEQTFVVYGADAFNTPTGGYDLLAAGKVSTDSGSWVTTDPQEITVPALDRAVVAVTVTVPADAAPGDHPAGIVVSRANPGADGQGVVVDTRVAVRLSLRVSGELDPALSVQGVHVSYHPSWVPFGGADATVSYTVKNTGNVTVVGQPRLRVTGPFGVTLASKKPEPTQEVLPGQSFTVTSTLAGVSPALVDTAVVDVTMAAAPGPQTDLPMASVSSRHTFLAMPWTGLALLVVAALAVRWGVRYRRARREESEEMWAELAAAAAGGDAETPVGNAQVPVGPETPVQDGEGGGSVDDGVETPAGDDAAEELAAEVPAGDATVLPRRTKKAPAGGAASVLLVAGLLGTGLALVAASSPARAMTDPTDQTTVSLSVPAVPEQQSPDDSTTSTQSNDGTTTTTKVTGGSPSSKGGGTSPGAASDVGVEPEAQPDDGSTPSPTPSATPTGPAMTADTLWRPPGGFTPAQWGLVSVSGSLVAGAGGLGGWMLWRRRRGEDLSAVAPLA